jgi:small membrane protein
MIIADLSQLPDETVSVGFMWIKILLILLLLVILRAFTFGRSLLLIKRLSAIGLFAVLVLLVLYPQVSNKIAHQLGVGRGVDLLFYLSHLFLLLLIVGLWRHSAILSDAVTKLTRQIAIDNARKPDGHNAAAGGSQSK